MDFINWNFILYLLAGLLIWVPVFLMIPFPLRSEGKWLITAVSFLLALFYLVGSQVFPLWQSLLLTALLLGMAAYFIQQKGAKFLAAEGQNQADEDLHEESFYEIESNPHPEFEEFHTQNRDEIIGEEDTISLDWLEERPNDQGDKLLEVENEANNELDWFIEVAASSQQEYPSDEDSSDSSVPPSDPEILEEWFENHSYIEGDTGNNHMPEEEISDALHDRNFLNELLEKSSDLEKSEISNDDLFIKGVRPYSISEEDAVIMDDSIPTDFALDILNDNAAEHRSDLSFEKEKNAGKEAELTEEEMKVFASWFEEDAVKDDLPVYDLDLDALEPIINEGILEEEGLSVVKASEEESEMAFDSVLTSSEQEFEHVESAEQKADELQTIEDIEEITDTVFSESAEEGEFMDRPLEESRPIQKSMPDDFLEVLYNQLIELKETSPGYEFNAIMDNVLISSKGIREYFVFVQLYLTYLEEKGQDIEFQNVYMEAMENLESYPYLKEQLSWTKKQQQ